MYFEDMAPFSWLEDRLDYGRVRLFINWKIKFAIRKYRVVGDRR